MKDTKIKKKSSAKPARPHSTLRTGVGQKRPAPEQKHSGFWKDVSSQYFRKIGPSEFADTIEGIVKIQESTPPPAKKEPKKSAKQSSIDTS